MLPMDSTPEEIDELLERAHIYFNGIKVDDVFYTWDDIDNMKEDHGD